MPYYGWEKIPYRAITDGILVNYGIPVRHFFGSTEYGKPFCTTPNALLLIVRAPLRKQLRIKEFAILYSFICESIIFGMKVLNMYSLFTKNMKRFILQQSSLDFILF